MLIGRPRVFSTIEVALLDLIGKATGRSVTDLLGGAARRRVPFAAYLFFKEEGDDDWGPALTPSSWFGRPSGSRIATGCRSSS